MNLKLTSLVAAAAFFMSIGMAHAGEAVQLSASQMDRITAGWSVDVYLDAKVRTNIGNYVDNKAHADQYVDVNTGCAFFASCSAPTTSTAIANNETTIKTNTAVLNTAFRIY